MSNNKDFKVKNGIQPTVYHEGLGTVVSGSEGYYLAGASYDSKSLNASSQVTAARDVAFNGDGSKAYVLQGSVYQYSLSTAFDLSTGSYDSVSFNFASQDTSPQGVAFNSDGTKMYMAGNQNDNIYQYSLSTAYNVGTASYDSVSFSISSQDSFAYGVNFNTGGTKMYVLGGGNDSVFQYTLSTAFDVSTASYDSISFSFTSQASLGNGMAFSATGESLFIIGTTNTVYQYSMSTSFDLSTASYDSVSFDVSSQDGDATGVTFSNSGTKMYVMGGNNGTVYQYSTALITAELDLSTGSVFDYTPTSDVQVTLSNPAASGTVSGATLLLGGEEATGVANTFSTTLYTGNSGTQTITNGLDLSTDGGLVWLKCRNQGSQGHFLMDSARNSFGNRISSHDTSAQATDGLITSVSTDGFTLGNKSYSNNTGDTYVSWSFKKQAKFFDVVTWSGNSTAGRTISHNLGSVPGMIVVKNLTTSGSGYSDWRVWHHSESSKTATLNTTDAFSTTDAASKFGNGSSVVQPTSTEFTVASDYDVNRTGETYVAYLFAHDTDASSLIKCGSYTGNGSTTGPVVDLGWEPQWVMIKGADIARGWVIADVVRGAPVGSNGQRLFANTSDAETAEDTVFEPTPTGFKIRGNSGTVNDSGLDYIYMAIRAENIPTITYDPTLEWPGGTAPTAPAKGETDILTFNTRDGGSTYQGVLAIDGAK